MRSIKEALREAASFLRRQGIAAPRREAELILAFLLAQETVHFYAHGEAEFPADLKAKYEEMLQRRGRRVPLAYLTGEKEFMGLPFRVKEGVLIPRPETEHLVETVLQWSREIFPGTADGQPLHILDLGTGCGNIAVSLAYLLPEAFVLGVDSSAAALALARLNAQKIGVDARVKFFCGEFRGFFAQNIQRFPVIVSNPPYIPRPEIPFLPPEVQNEPLLALNGGKDGLDAYRTIFSSVREALYSPGLLALEVGENQAADVLALGRQAGFIKARIVPDLAGRERVVAFSDQEWS
jgi:release factor glutamine methyltransferase